MSIFGDAADDILGGDDLNEAIVDENLPSEAEEDDKDDGEKAAVKVEPKKRSVRNPRPRLTIETLTGPRGIHTIENYFKDMKFLGKGNEKKDLNEVMRRLQHWAHRMYPNYKFDDVLANIERLGKKKEIQRHMIRYRQGLLEQNEEGQVEEENIRDEVAQDEPFDEFDALLGEQIAISKLASRTPSHYSNMSAASSVVNTPKFTEANAIASTPHHDAFEDEVEPMTPVQAVGPQPTKLTAEQMARIAENRRLAQERLKARREANNVLE